MVVVGTHQCELNLEQVKRKLAETADTAFLIIFVQIQACINDYIKISHLAFSAPK